MEQSVNLVALPAIIGIVNGISLAKQQDKWPFIMFVAAVLSGMALGYFSVFGLTVETGLVTALASSGLYKVAQKLGGM